VTKVVAFGAFVEILPGVEGLVHISELADHHVENPSEVVEPGATLNVKILEIDEERRRLSLSIKRVEGQNMAMAGLGEQIAQAEGGQGDAAEETEEQAPPPTGSMADAFADAAAAADTTAEEQPAAEEQTSAEEQPAAEEQPSEEAPGDLPQEVEASEDAEPAPVAEENGTTEGGEDPGEHQEGESAQERPDSPDDVDEASGEDSSGDDAQTGESEQG
jgi:small subunit ribosomal protein S1